MATYFRMPGVSADSDEAVLEAWTVEQGTQVESGQTIATVETEKAVVDVPSEVDAILWRLLVENGATVAVGDPIAILLAPDEPASAAEKLLADLGLGDRSEAETIDVALHSVPEEATAPDGPSNDSLPGSVTATVGAGVIASPPPGFQSTNGGGGRRFASPIARRLAKELDVDVDSLVGTGPGGRIVRDDVTSAAAAKSSSAPAASAAPTTTETAPAAASPAKQAVSRPGWTEIPNSKLRKLVASRLQSSKQTAPHFYLRSSLRVDDLLSLRAQINASGGDRVSVNDFFVKAAAKALIDVPEMNVIWTDDAVLQAPTADIAIAVASERGLVTPVIEGIESLSLSALSAKIKGAVSRANEGKLQQSELEGGTLTVSNLGMFGVEEFDAIINPPQAGILAVGAAVRKPLVADNDELEIGTVVSVVLSVDHRPVDGAIGARWLSRFRELIENPISIVV
ncbi:MAG: dihydrolipoamide acetyltransferase family protein [Nakamurella sp.]